MCKQNQRAQRPKGPKGLSVQGPKGPKGPKGAQGPPFPPLLVPLGALLCPTLYFPYLLHCMRCGVAVKAHYTCHEAEATRLQAQVCPYCICAN